MNSLVELFPSMSVLLSPSRKQTDKAIVTFIRPSEQKPLNTLNRNPTFHLHHLVHLRHTQIHRRRHLSKCGFPIKLHQQTTPHSLHLLHQELDIVRQTYHASTLLQSIENRTTYPMH